MEKKTTSTAITKSFAKKMETISPFELKNKLIRYGLAQGYDYEAVRDAADALIATTDDSCDTFF